MTLKELRQKAKLSIAEAAAGLGITERYLTMLESEKDNRHPSMELIGKMSSLYKTKPEKIFLATYRTVRSG